MSRSTQCWLSKQDVDQSLSLYRRAGTSEVVGSARRWLNLVIEHVASGVGADFPAITGNQRVARQALSRYHEFTSTTRRQTVEWRH